MAWSRTARPVLPEPIQGTAVGKAGKVQNQAAFQARAINLVPVTNHHQPPPPGQAVCEARLDAVPVPGVEERILKLKLDVNGPGLVTREGGRLCRRC